MCYKCNFLVSWYNCGIFKQASENCPNDFHSICGSKDVAMRIC